MDIGSSSAFKMRAFAAFGSLEMKKPSVAGGSQDRRADKNSSVGKYG
jgi:hypothetical protein